MIQKHNKPISILMVGVGGYGEFYLKTLWEEVASESYILCGIVDPYADQSVHFPEIQKQKIPVFSEIQDFYNSGHSADLAVIASPIQYHVEQSIIALTHNSNVLCEKPIGATIQDVDQLIEAGNTSGKWVMIGYQWSYSKAIQSLKSDIMKGLFGRSIRFKTLCLWPRSDNYYQPNKWVGRIKDDEGRWVLSSPVNNAMAHFLHNLLYVIGSEKHLSATPKYVTAELYRINPIENYDTAACRIVVEDNTEVLFYGSHATETEIAPRFQLEFENAVVAFGEDENCIVVTNANGIQKGYGSPDDDHQFKKLFDAMNAVNTELCGLEASRPQTLCMNGIQESVPDIPAFPKSIVRRTDEENRWWVTGLDEVLIDCYQKAILPSEAKYTWAAKGTTINLTDYRFFPGGNPPLD